MGYMIWYYIWWNFEIEDMILYPILEKKSYHIYIFFSLEIWSISRVKVCDPGNILHCFLVCFSRNKHVRFLERGCELYQTFDYKGKFQVETSIKLKKLVLKFILAHVLFCQCDLNANLSRAYVYYELWEDISQNWRYEERYFLGTIDMDIDMIWYISPFHFGIWI